MAKSGPCAIKPKITHSLTLSLRGTVYKTIVLMTIFSHVQNVIRTFLHKFNLHACKFRSISLIPRPFRCSVCDDQFESRLFLERHICHGPPDTASETCFSDRRGGHCVISIDVDNEDERFPIQCIPAPRRVFTRDNPECDGSLPRPLFINFTQSIPPPTKLFQCDTSFRSFLNLDSLSSHIATNHLLPDYNCFRRSNTAKRKSFASCHLCDALFASKSLFNHHPCISAPREEDSSWNNSGPHQLSYPNFSLGVDLPPMPSQLESSYPNFSLGVTFPPTPMPPEVICRENLESHAVINNENETSAGTSNTSTRTPQTNDDSRVITNGSQPPSSHRKTWRCDVPGCKIVKKSKKGLTIHKYREHHIPFPKRDIPSSTQPSQVNRNDQNNQVENSSQVQGQNQNEDSSFTADDPITASTQQCPTRTSHLISPPMPNSLH
ncbi:hypothetical protein AVEN_229992-1 [Araneus ventricosus]|uniref:C2H2-type domain-containing protein n=1 Tax=Araneus ventricosus TaxID=182803 RepID=A0A4Y2WP33_ARAVE|nr:hypothetical protein AVEN_229992-1 [Araneus ventricosus]